MTQIINFSVYKMSCVGELMTLYFQIDLWFLF